MLAHNRMVNPNCQICSALDHDDADRACQRGYGADYLCDLDNGLCAEEAWLRSPPSSINWGLILGLLLGVILLIIIVALVLFFFKQRSRRSPSSEYGATGNLPQAQSLVPFYL